MTCRTASCDSSITITRRWRNRTAGRATEPCCASRQNAAPIQRQLKDPALVEWLDGRIAAGQRYQFRSADSSNTSRMISHFRDSASGAIDVPGAQVPYVQVGDTQLICIAHSDTTDIVAGFNENYISMLRDRVAEQTEVFKQTSL